MAEEVRPRSWYVEAIEAELRRIGVTTWRLAAGTGYREQFKGRDFDFDDELEICSDEYGSSIRRGQVWLETLRQIPDGAGDEALAEFS